jgi:hypothetical protein
MWKTWLEGEIDTPWPWIPVDRVQEYKHRDHPSIKLSPEKVEAVYLSFKPEIITEFEANHIDAIMVACLVDAVDRSSAIAAVTTVFADAEIVSCDHITDSTLPEVLDLFEKNGRR